MIKVIIVSGTPGTGKTTVARAISKELKLAYIDVNKIIEGKKLSKGYDRKRACKIVNTKKLIKALISLLKEPGRGVVIDSHLSHYLPPKYAHLCIITKCPLKTLQKRLSKRGYTKSKIRENLDSEIFDICRVEAIEKGHMILTIDTARKRSGKILSKEVLITLKKEYKK